jgi:hypothetical protein
MDRRTKIILLSIGSVILLGVIIWLVIWPLLKPVLPTIRKAQPPAIEQPSAQNPQVTNSTTSEGQGAFDSSFTFDPGDYPDAEQIAELSRRAGVFSEMMESGSNENAFENIALSAEDASPNLAQKLLEKRTEMKASHPANGELYLTIAQRLVEIPEHEAVIGGDTFSVRVQMQVRVKFGDASTVEYRESIVTFTNVNGDFLLSGYEVGPFTP